MLVDSRPLAPPRHRPNENTQQRGHEAADRWGEANPYLAGIDNLAGAVTVVTSADGGGARFGVTCTSVCSLSVEPPILIACIPRNSTLGRDVGRTGHFCVNVLTSEQRAIAERFETARGAGDDRFEHGRWICGATGSPVLEDALASLECAVELMYGYPEHLVVAGKVQHVSQTTVTGEPLVHVARRYAQIEHDSAAVAAS